MTQPELELSTLRDYRDIDIAIRALESQAKAVAKRYRRGIELLHREQDSLDNLLDSGDDTFGGMSPQETRSQQLQQLIADPVLTNIPEETGV